MALVAIVGGAVGHWRRVPIAPVSALVFYLFSPALVFHSMAKTTLSIGASLQILAVMAITFVALYLVATIWSSAVRHDAKARAGFALATTVPNLGNMGLPVARLAFGQAGLEVAVVNFVMGSVLAN